MKKSLFTLVFLSVFLFSSESFSQELSPETDSQEGIIPFLTSELVSLSDCVDGWVEVEHDIYLAGVYLWTTCEVYSCNW